MQFDKCYKHPVIHILSYIINWSSVVINPIIYVVSQKKYQDALKYTKNALVSACLCGQDSEKVGVQKISVNFEVYFENTTLFEYYRNIFLRTSQGSKAKVGVGVTPSFEISGEDGEEAHPLL